MTEHITYAEEWTERGGPKPTEYHEFNEWLNEVAHDVESGKVTEEGIKDLQFAFGRALSVSTLQGISLIKPRGYAGDFEVIDRVYQRSLTTDPNLINWDNFLVNTRAAKAVRNRKSYVIKMLEKLRANTEGDEQIRVLDVASGPARDVFEFLSSTSDHRIFFDCIEYDNVAIQYASALCHEYLDRIEFIHKNAFRFDTDRRYKLVWSAGLFDYFDDRRFVFLLKRLYAFLEEGGELVIGNFSEKNPDRPYMEVMMEWELNHRSPEKLIHFATEGGVPASNIRLGNEPEGINLFLHLTK